MQFVLSIRTSETSTPFLLEAVSISLILPAQWLKPTRLKRFRRGYLNEGGKTRSEQSFLVIKRGSHTISTFLVNSSNNG